jgi:ribose transport system substrate-binding protein
MGLLAQQGVTARRGSRAFAVAGVVASLAVAAAGCGSDDESTGSSGGGGTDTGAKAESGTVSVDVGTDKPIELKKGKLRFGIFVPTAANEYMKTYIKSAKAAVAEAGGTSTVVDANFDPALQVNQIQNAIQQKKIDVAVVHAADGTATCNATTKLRPAANILVSVVTISQCDTATTQKGDSGEELWAPGTLNYVGSNNTLKWNVKWFEAAAAANPGPQKAVVVLGQATGGQARVLMQSLKMWRKANPDSEFEVADIINSDYSTADAFKQTQSYLQAHKDTTVMMPIYSPDMAIGVVKGITSAKMTDKVKVATQGGDPYSVDGIKKGTVQLTMPLYPATSAKLGVESILKAQKGEAPRFVDDSATNGENSIENPLVLSKDNIDKAPTEYP